MATVDGKGELDHRPERASRMRSAARGRRGIRWWWVPLWMACRTDGATPVLHTAVDGGQDETAEASAGATDEPTEGAAVTDGRDLWFAEGPGRAAIIARERRDHARARAELDALLAREDLSADARGGAELLRGLEHLRAEHWDEAAQAFARAREAPGLAPIELRLRRWEAQARLDAGQPEQALAVVQAVAAATWARSAVGGDAQVIEGDARWRTDDTAGAEAAYRAYLREHADGERRFEVRAKLARLLAEREQPEPRREALGLLDELRRTVPLSDYAEEAEEAIARLEREVGPLRKGAAATTFARELAVLEAEAQLDRHHYGKAVKAVDRLIAKGSLTSAQRCRLWYVKGSAIFKQRRRADARSSFDKADRECAKAGKGFETTRVKSRYQGARGYYAAGKYAKAGKAFEAIAAEHPRHSYADDALVLAGESWESHGDAERAAEAYRRAVEDHPGDMRHEAVRRLMLMRFAAGEEPKALALIDITLDKTASYDVLARGKLLYFRGRALERLGRSEEATAAWLETLDVAPLDYPGLQALSRLRERGGEVFTDGLARLAGATEAEAATRTSADPASLARATVLARLGLGDEARDELRHAGIEGWPRVELLTQAGLYPAAQRELADLGTGWRSDPPGPGNRVHWEGAHPRPFTEIIVPGEQAHAVPSLLTYAIMQTESRFDPGVTSGAGARGLVQLMPGTAQGLAKSAGVRIDGDSALYQPALNLDLGMRYLGKLTARYQGEGDGPVALAIPSYNAGAGSVDRWLSERGEWELDLFIEAIPYDETRKYTQSVLGRWHAYRWLYGDGEPDARVPYLPLGTPRKG